MSISSEAKQPATVGEIFQFHLLKTDELAVRLASDGVLGNDANPFPLVDEATFLGIEIEVEGMTPQPTGKGIDLAPFWSAKEDGSLRNTGLEFVSVPLRGRSVAAALTVISKLLNEVYTKHDFSDRTSIHIHVNVRDMLVEWVINLMLTYSVFESALYKSAFDFTQKKRDDNIFCVSLFDAGKNLQLAKAINSFENGKLSQCLSYLSQGWKKYSGVNCIPIQSFGTIEFRQLGGTENIRKIVAWINLILAMKIFAQNSIFSMLKERILELNTNSMYEMFTQEVFRNQADQILRYNVKNELERGVNYVKYLFSGFALSNQEELTPEKFMKSSLKSFYDANYIEILSPLDYHEKYAKKKPLREMSGEELVKHRADISLARKKIQVQYKLANDAGELAQLPSLELESNWLREYLRTIDYEIHNRGMLGVLS